MVFGFHRVRKTAAMVEDVEAAGGVSLKLSRDRSRRMREGVAADEDVRRWRRYIEGEKINPVALITVIKFDEYCRGKKLETPKLIKCAYQSEVKRRN